MDSRGLIHLYCGDGKGKTTAALGLTLRAAGAGMKVVFVQFLKNHKTSELVSLEKTPNITVFRGKEGAAFSFSMTQEEKEKSKLIHTENLKLGIECVLSGNCDMLVLDEAIPAFRRDLIDKELLENLIKNKPEHLELVLTGRNPEQWMIEHADYVSEIKKVKHPFDKGIKARLGIER